LLRIIIIGIGLYFFDDRCHTGFENFHIFDFD
jgi:hypothetical protein